MQDELLVKLVFNNQMLFCGIFGAFGGVVHSLDLRSKLNILTIIQKVIISTCAGLLLFFATYDLSSITPAIRIAASIVAGFYGSALFRYLARFYGRQLPNIDKSNSSFIDQLDKENDEDKRVKHNPSEEKDDDFKPNP